MDPKLRKRRRVAVPLAIGLSGILCPSSSAYAGGVSSSTAGGDLNVAEVTSQWPGLDPATDPQDLADLDYMNAIYGQLFDQGPKGQPVPDLATGYTVSKDHLLVTINLRHGVRFSDGTPFNASAVVYNIKRDLDPKNACTCLGTWGAVSSVTQDGNYAVQLHLKEPFAPMVQAFLGNAPNWIASPTALQKDGEQAFAQKPVGAGPFEVVSNVASSKLVLKRNPHYWQAGAPHLSNLTFTEVGSDESAYESLEAGQTQIVNESGNVDPSVAQQAASSKTLLTLPGIYSVAIELNTRQAPFNNLKAREAAYYATNSQELLTTLGYQLGKKATISESSGGPADNFWQKTVPGYRTFNLKKAEELVHSIGGLNVTITSGGQNTAWVQAIANQWQAAGMKVTIQSTTLTQEIVDYTNHKWQAIVGNTGSADPALGIGGLATFFSSQGRFSEVADPTLDSLINKGAALYNANARAAIYKQINKRLSDKAYVVFTVSQPLALIVAPGVSGAKVTAGPEGPQVPWADLELK